jgi:hypothetical protein
MRSVMVIVCTHGCLGRCSTLTFIVLWTMRLYNVASCHDTPAEWRNIPAQIPANWNNLFGVFSPVIFNWSGVGFTVFCYRFIDVAVPLTYYQGRCLYLYCICIVFVLYLYCIYIVFVLYLYCICIVFVSCLYCICIVFVLCLYCICILLYFICIVFVLYLYVEHLEFSAEISGT